MRDKRTIKIFISSPGDVLYERQIAKRVIAKLGKEFATSLKLEALMWEDMPLQVTSSFQEGIDQVAHADIVDIAIFILWSRLGTPLNKKFVKPDGSHYKSGTEYEFEMMYAANQQSGTPSILAYIKNAPIADAIFKSSSGADFDFEEIGKQHKETQRFIREKFYDPETKTVYGAFHQFEASNTFEQKLTEHLRRMIIDIIGDEAIPVEWEGNPYVGLRSFSYDENAIFYGRRNAINAIEEKIARCLPDKAPSLFILGESGSGKSSLVRAGLLPDIIEFGWIENTKWKWFDVTPSKFRGNIYNGVVAKLVEAFPVLTEKTLGKDMMEGKEINFGHLADILPEKTNESVLFFIDQFEEIFTDPLITEQERTRTFALLKGIVSTNRIWMIFSMRSDFYHKFTSYPTLLELRNDSIVYDIPKILHSELQEIIEEPAKKAGLKWETNERGIPLNRTIINEVNSGVDDLPLIEFALSELYNLRNENNVLTYKAYEDIGKIDGAVVKYVENFYNALSENEKELFYQILSALIAPSIENKNLYVRKTALQKDLQKTELHRQLLNNLINSHILISGKDDNDDATVTVVHEILISKWNIIQDWVEQEKYFIDKNNHYENLSKYWTEHNKSKNDLLQGNVAIKESEYFLYSWENNLSRSVKDFLFASIKKKRRKSLPWILFALLIAGIVGVVWCVQYISDNASRSMENILFYLLITGLFIYFAWKKIKAVPIYRTINISLVILSALFVLSIALLFVSRGSDWLFFAFVLLKLGYTVIQKREIQQWQRRIFNRSSYVLSSFVDNFAILSQKIPRRTFIWGISVLLIALLAAGGYYIFNVFNKNRITGSGTVTVERREVSPFDRIRIAGTFTVYLSQGETESVEVEIDDNLQQYVVVRNDGRILVLDIKENVQFGRTTKNNVYITLKNIDMLNISGVSTVKTSNSLNCDNLTLDISGVTTVELELYCSKLNVNISGVSNVVLRGETIELDVRNSGTGGLDAMSFSAAIANIQNSGVGNVSVYATQELSMTNSGVGNIIYAGDAVIKSMESTGVGNIQRAR